MTANWVPTQISGGPNAGRILDTARGILIGLRRCPPGTALDELHTAAQRHKVSVFAMAWALVHLAGDGATSHVFADAQSAVRREWGQWFARPAGSPAGSTG
ncbi:ANTAR domain-containing protein [Mycobacterium gastri]|uniref:Antitermination regulator n=1 Tax=Mycobacterium gastri TaxID=1777 RepID=A0A1X1UNE7_MYCGS|nr:ANTAR domain-containing protein [Mycobacterium gastri]ETW21716.1 transcription antitermination regulator [Mycobacterium gastri 'Wayne']ORV58365.1 antitermination regulator [Mycobacterium gastri]